MRWTQSISIETAIIIIFSLLACFISLLKFINPESPIGHTGGAELVVVTTVTIALFSGLTCFFKIYSWQRFILSLFTIILLLGTLFACYLLESWFVLGLMFIVLFTWIVKFFHKNG